jgi:hypothetical protein
VAITNQRFGKVFVPNIKKEFLENIHRISAASDLVFLSDSELHDECLLYPDCGDNVYWLAPGHLNYGFRDNVIFNGAWFSKISDMYQQIPHHINSIDPYVKKEKLLDVLLGLQKDHREFVYNAIVNAQLEQKCILTYYGKNNQWVDDAGVVQTQPIEFASSRVTVYDGIETMYSQIVPTEVYNSSSYSIITETNFDNAYSFFTEKTAKPILCRRLFIAFSGQYFLKNLRNVGFRTFDGIIDESYDEIEDNQERWQQAFNQMIALSNMDQQSVLNKIRVIVDHNYDVLTKTDWFSQGVYGIVNRIKHLTATDN